MIQNLDKNIPILLPSSYLDSEEKRQTLSAAALDDGGHGVFYPTDVIVKNGEMVGWLSVGFIPTCYLWLSTKHLTARDSVNILQVIEGVQRRLGAPALVMPCKPTSPFRPVMGKLGFQQGDNLDFFWKQL
jgi:hypothetical protein